MVGSRRDLKLKPIACTVCGKKDEICVCPECRIVHYCSEEHRQSNEALHGPVCLKLKQTFNMMQQQAQQEPTGQVLITVPPGQAPPGSDELWRLFNKSMQMRNQFNTLNLILEAFGGPGGYQFAVQVVLGRMAGLGHQVRGTEFKIPPLYLRLGSDQQAYDFVKSFAAPKSGGCYMGEDPFESPKGLWSDPETIHLCHAVCVALIKTRLLLDLRVIQKTRRAFGGTLLEEIIVTICSQQVGSLIKARRDLVWADLETVSALIQTIKGQLKDLYATIGKSNKYFWGHLLLGGESMMKMQMINGRSRATPEVAWYVVKQTYAAWAETTGALDLIEEIYVHEQMTLMRDKIFSDGSDVNVSE